MRNLKLTINPKSHAMDRLKERLSIVNEPREVVSRLNQNFDAGFYEERRERVYVGALGYFGIVPDRKYRERYYCMTFYIGKPPSNYRPSVTITWFLDIF